METKFPPLDDDVCYIQAGDLSYFDEDKALIILLRNEVCFFGSIWHPDKKTDEEGAYLGIGVFVLCNDLFYWACADSEDLHMSEVEDLYRHYRQNKEWGGWVWACKHRGLQPQKPVKVDMIKAGVWTEELEALPEPEPS
ncbi:MAG: hypothetical protein ABID84_04735 [Chloroflexota bacterium]